MVPLLLLALGCAPKVPTAAAVADNPRRGPPEALVRADLGCPAGPIEWTGGLGTPDQVVLRTLEACGKSATYAWTEAGWAMEPAEPARVPTP